MNDFILAKFAALQAFFATLVQPKGEDGATAVEYGMLVALIAAAIVVTVGLLGEQILAAFDSITDALAA